MRIRYFEDTDTLYIEFRQGLIVESRDIDENTVVEVDAQGNLCAMTMEHARERAALPECSFERMPAG